MTVNIVALHKIDAEHLTQVMDEMRTLGAPTIRCTESAWGLMALEGTHRLEAANRLELTPHFILVEYDDIISHDFQDLDNPCAVGDILEYMCMAPTGEFYRFDTDVEA